MAVLRIAAKPFWVGGLRRNLDCLVLNREIGLEVEGALLGRFDPSRLRALFVGLKSLIDAVLPLPTKD